MDMEDLVDDFVTFYVAGKNYIIIFILILLR